MGRKRKNPTNEPVVGNTGPVQETVSPGPGVAELPPEDGNTNPETMGPANAAGDPGASSEEEGALVDASYEVVAEESTPPEPEPVKELCKEYLRRNFTPEEMGTLGQQMSRAHQELVHVNENLATIKADFKSRITNLENEVSNFSRQIAAGHTMDYVECVVTRDFDKKRVIIHRADTGELVRERRMTLEEQQRSLLSPETPADVAEHFGAPPPPEDGAAVAKEAPPGDGAAGEAPPAGETLPPPPPATTSVAGLGEDYIPL